MLDSPVIPAMPLVPVQQAGPGQKAMSQDAVQRAAKKAGEEFEALFIAEMLGPVFEGLSSEGMFGGGSGEKIYRSLMVQEYGKAIARAGGVGIAETVQSEMLKMQEMQS